MKLADRQIVLQVSPKEFSELGEWSALGEAQFLSLVYRRWPLLRDLPFGKPVKVAVMWDWK